MTNYTFSQEKVFDSDQWKNDFFGKKSYRYSLYQERTPVEELSEDFIVGKSRKLIEKTFGFPDTKCIESNELYYNYYLEGYYNISEEEISQIDRNSCKTQLIKSFTVLTFKFVNDECVSISKIAAGG